MDDFPQFTLDQFREVVATIREAPDDLVRMVRRIQIPVPLERVEADLHRVGAILDSMTDSERLHPETVEQSRMERIARGSGTNLRAVERMLRDFRQLQRNWDEMSASAKQQIFDWEEELEREFPESSLDDSDLDDAS